MTVSVVGVLERIGEISNTYLTKNVDRLLTKRPTASEIEWVGKNRLRIPENKILRWLIDFYTRLFVGWSLGNNCFLPVTDWNI